MRVSLEIPLDEIFDYVPQDGCLKINLLDDRTQFPKHITEGLEKLDLTDDELVVVEKSVNAVLLARKIKSWVKFKE